MNRAPQPLPNAIAVAGGGSWRGVAGPVYGRRARLMTGCGRLLTPPTGARGNDRLFLYGRRRCISAATFPLLVLLCLPVQAGNGR